jgi:hypothetical protein
MSLPKVTVCLYTLAKAATLISVPTIKTATIRFTIDFITALLKVTLDCALSLRVKHQSQLPYDKKHFKHADVNARKVRKASSLRIYTNLYIP